MFNQSLDYQALLYGAPSPAVANRIDGIIGSLGNFGGWLGNKLTQVKEKFFSSEAINRAVSTIYQVGSGFRDDLIIPVTLDNYNPNLLTSRYIMANPELFELHLDGFSNDFDSTFINFDTTNPYFRDDYLNVMDGIYEANEEGGSATHFITGEENPLDEIDQFRILDAWDISNGLRVMGLDPTSRQ